MGRGQEAAQDEYEWHALHEQNEALSWEPQLPTSKLIPVMSCAHFAMWKDAPQYQGKENLIVKVAAMSGTTCKVQVSLWSTIRDVKNALKDKLQMGWWRFSLVLGNKVISRAKPLTVMGF